MARPLRPFLPPPLRLIVSRNFRRLKKQKTKKPFFKVLFSLVARPYPRPPLFPLVAGPLRTELFFAASHILTRIPHASNHNSILNFLYEQLLDQQKQILTTFFFIFLFYSIEWYYTLTNKII